MTAPGLNIRDVALNDHEDIGALLNAAFEGAGEATLVQDLWRQNAVTCELLAEKGGVIVGYCAYSQVTCEPPLDGLLLGLAPLAVTPEYQRQGVGGALVTGSLKICHDAGARLIAVLGHRDYYGRFGFESASTKNMSWSGRDAGDAFRVIADDDITTDYPRSIHYHPAFDRFS